MSESRRRFDCEFKIPVSLSLAIIAGIITCAVIASRLMRRVRKLLHKELQPSKRKGRSLI